jgi:hypothetical protein
MPCYKGEHIAERLVPSQTEGNGLYLVQIEVNNYSVQLHLQPLG